MCREPHQVFAYLLVPGGPPAFDVVPPVSGRDASQVGILAIPPPTAPGGRPSSRTTVSDFREAITPPCFL